VANSGFSGLLWCPEVRDSKDGNDLLRRLQTIVFSAHALINSWRIPSPPWKQTDIQKNLAGEEMKDSVYYTDETRKLFELRMRMLPYLYSAFVEYAKCGKPPVRAVVIDYDEDANTHGIDDQYFFGESMLVCPLTFEDGTEREIYLPEGTWYHFFSKKKYEGGKKYLIHADYTEIPVFVKEGAMIPLAQPVQHVEKDTVFDITVEVFGKGEASFVLYEDDFETYDYEKNYSAVTLKVDENAKLFAERSNEAFTRYRFGEVKVWM
jgi:alpha-D-xyloside xylohydrolase